MCSVLKNVSTSGFPLLQYRYYSSGTYRYGFLSGDGTYKLSRKDAGLWPVIRLWASGISKAVAHGLSDRRTARSLRSQT